MSKLATRMYSTCFSGLVVGYWDRIGRCARCLSIAAPLECAWPCSGGEWTEEGREVELACEGRMEGSGPSCVVDCEPERLLLLVKERRRCVLDEVPVELVLGRDGSTVAMLCYEYPAGCHLQVILRHVMHSFIIVSPLAVTCIAQGPAGRIRLSSHAQALRREQGSGVVAARDDVCLLTFPASLLSSQLISD